MADDDSKKGDCTAHDELIAGPVLPGGVRPFIRHTKDHQICSGIMRPVREGEPLYEGAVHLEHKQGDTYKVTDIFEPPAEATSKGPAKVNSRAYRANYDAIFGNRTVGQA